MKEKILYGKPIAEEWNEKSKAFNLECVRLNKRKPKLVVLMVGDSQASMSYVLGLKKLCQAVDMDYDLLTMDESVSESELIQSVKDCNNDDTIDGILIQMPLPNGINTDRVIMSSDPDKDVDGFHPLNIGKLWMNRTTYAPCTALSVMKFLEATKIDLTGKKIVIIGRSNIVGKPLAALCLNKNATVTLCHSKTKNIEQETASADILIAAVGQAKMIKSNWVKEGAIVLDVGVNRDEENKLCGDVDFDDVIDKVAMISPVPKGIGVVTNAMLLQNTIDAYRRKEDKHGL